MASDYVPDSPGYPSQNYTWTTVADGISLNDILGIVKSQSSISTAWTTTGTTTNGYYTPTLGDYPYVSVKEPPPPVGTYMYEVLFIGGPLHGAPARRADKQPSLHVLCCDGGVPEVYGPFEEYSVPKDAEEHLYRLFQQAGSTVLVYVHESLDLVPTGVPGESLLMAQQPPRPEPEPEPTEAELPVRRPRKLKWREGEPLLPGE